MEVRMPVAAKGKASIIYIILSFTSMFNLVTIYINRGFHPNDGGAEYTTNGAIDINSFFLFNVLKDFFGYY